MNAWSHDDRRFMRQAIALATRPADRVSPNPRVGAVVVRAGRVVGRGFHAGPGSEHGEAMALRRAGTRARGATLYLNLEPCAHWGRTPPCTDAILASGASRVVFAIGDPDSRVRGRGARILARAGVRVERGLEAERATALNRGYLHWKKTGRPWVALKLAMTLDGRMADRRGRSRWVTGEASRRLVHAMRREADLVMVGRGTLAADDPALDVRLPGAGTANPLRLVVDSRLRADPALRFFDPAAAARTLVATTGRAPAARVRALEARGIRVLRIRASRDGRVSLGALLARLGRGNITRVLVEGGAELAAALLAEGLVDEAAIFHAPILLGADRAARGSVAGGMLPSIGVPDLAGAMRFEAGGWRTVGEDALFVGRPMRRVARSKRTASRGA